MMIKRFCYGAALALLMAAPAPAQEATDGWQVSITPYIWASALDNELINRSTGEIIDSSSDFGDILDNISGIFIVKGEIQYDRAGAYGDFIYLKLSPKSTIDRPLLGTVERKADISTTSSTFSVFYRVVDSDDLDVDVLAGFRHIKLEVDVDVETAGSGLRREVSRSITEPIVGVRATQKVGPRSSLTGYGDYGGFDNSATVWQVYGTYNYHWTPKLIGSIGYRYFVVETQNSHLSSDMTLNGPLLGLTYRF